MSLNLFNYVNDFYFQNYQFRKASEADIPEMWFNLTKGFMNVDWQLENNRTQGCTKQNAIIDFLLKVIGR